MVAVRGQWGSGLSLFRHILSLWPHPEGWLPQGHEMAAAPTVSLLYSRIRSVISRKGERHRPAVPPRFRVRSQEPHLSTVHARSRSSRCPLANHGCSVECHYFIKHVAAHNEIRLPLMRKKGKTEIELLDVRELLKEF